MRSAIGREFGTVIRSLPICASDIRKWALAIYWPKPPPKLFWDEAYAATTQHRGIVAPEEFNPFAWFTADGPVLPRESSQNPLRSGPEGALKISAPDTHVALNGGREIVHGVRMRPGDVITQGPTKLVDYRERSTRHGLTLITVTESTWTNQSEETVRVTRGTSLRY